MENNTNINKEALKEAMKLDINEMIAGLDRLDLTGIENVLSHEEFKAIRAGISACLDIVERRCYGNQSTELEIEKRIEERSIRSKNKITELKERRRAQ